MNTALTNLLKIRRPIIQGGLAYLAHAELAAGVSNAGGLGQITATTLSGPEELEAEIARCRSLTDKPFGVNFALGHHSIDDLLSVALNAHIPVISLTGGNPAPYSERILASGARLMVLVAGVRAAVKAESVGASVVIGVGVEGGGHLGRDDIGTMVLTRRLVDAVKIPVVASGGIGDGRQWAAALALGASGVEMGTRFVATQECIAHELYKQALVDHDMQETAIIERSLGRPGRTLLSSHVSTILEKEANSSSMEDVLPLIRGELNYGAALEGRLDEGFVWAGQAIGLIHDIPTVAELMDRMEAQAQEGYKALVDAWGPSNELL